MSESEEIANEFERRFSEDCYAIAVELSIYEIVERLLPIMEARGWCRPEGKE